MLIIDNGKPVSGGGGGERALSADLHEVACAVDLAVVAADLGAI